VPDQICTTSSSPMIATAAPASVRRLGGCRRTTQTQPMTSTGPRYSSSSAMLTGMYRTALKNATCTPAIASSP
jgi:hypothetical protein